MVMRNRIAVIDPGTSSLRLLVGEKDENGIKIIAGVCVPSSGVKRGEIVNIMQTLNSLNAAVAKMKSDYDIEVSRAYVVCATSDMECITKSGNMDRSENLWNEMVSTEELKQIKLEVMSEVNQSDIMVYTIIPQAYNIDNYMGLVEDEVEGTIGKHISGTFRVITGKKQYVNACINVCRRAGIDICGYIISPIACSFATLSYDDRELGVALVDIGASTTKVSVVKNNVTSYCGVIGFGGNNITEDIMKECNVGSDIAEAIKKKYSICLSSKVERDLGIIIPAGHGREKRKYTFEFIAKIIEARMSELLEAALWHIDRSGLRDELGAGLVISGGCANTQFITDLAYRITGMGCQIADSTRSISNDTSLDFTEPELTTAAGAIIYCFSGKDAPVCLENGNSGLNNDLFSFEEAKDTVAGDEKKALEERDERERQERIAREEREKEMEMEKESEKIEKSKRNEEKRDERKRSFIKKIGDIFGSGNVFTEDDEA